MPLYLSHFSETSTTAHFDLIEEDHHTPSKYTA